MKTHEGGGAAGADLDEYAEVWTQQTIGAGVAVGWGSRWVWVGWL